MCDERRTESESTDNSNATFITDLSEDSDPRKPRRKRNQEYTHRNKTGLPIYRNKRRKCLRITEHLVNFVGSVVVAVAICKFSSHFDSSTESPDLCFDCSHLSVYIDTWAWEEVIDNRESDKCCFKNKYEMMQTITSYKDLKTSIVESQLARVNSDIEDLQNGQSPGNNGTRRLPTDLKKLLGDIAQKKRSILYLRSESSFDTGHGFIIIWSTSELTSPITQGNLKTQYDNRRIQITETGIFTVRLEIKFEHELLPTQTVKQANLMCQLKKYGANGGLPGTIDQFTKTVLFTNYTTDFVGNIDTIVRLKKGDAVEVSCPYQEERKNFVSTYHGAHRISVIEES